MIAPYALGSHSRDRGNWSPILNVLRKLLLLSIGGLLARYTITSAEGDRVYVVNAHTAIEALAHLDMITVMGLPTGVVMECFTTNILQHWQLVELAEAEEQSGQEAV